LLETVAAAVLMELLQVLPEVLQDVLAAVVLEVPQVLPAVLLTE